MPLLALATCAVAGCAFLSPYDHEPPPYLSATANGSSQERFAGRAAEGLAYAEKVRAGYFTNLRGGAATRALSAVAATGLTAKALYTALKPNAGSESDKRMLATLGGGLGALYGLRELFVNGEQEGAYLEGYLTLSCLMLESSALLMTTSAPDTHTAATSTAASTREPASSGMRTDLNIGGRPSATGRAGVLFADTVEVRNQPWNFMSSMDSSLAPTTDLERFELELNILEAKIYQVHAATSDSQSRADLLAGSSLDIKDSQAALRRRIKGATEALAYARNAHSDGHTLLQTVQRSGRTIENQVGIVMGTVNSMLQSRQHDLGKPTDNLKMSKGVATGIQNIGNATAADQQQVSGGMGAAGATSTTTLFSDSKAAASVASSQSDLLLAGPISAALEAMERLQLRSEESFNRVLLAAAASSASDASGSRRSGTGRDASQNRVRPPSPRASESRSAIASLPRLEAICSALDAAIKELNDRKAAAEQDAKKAALERERKRIEAALRSLNEKAELCSGKGARGLDACTIALAGDIESLYAARRPVVQRLLDFRKQVREAAAVPACEALAPLRISPNEATRLYAGQSATFTISQRGAGNPIATLVGAGDKESGVTLDYTPIGGSSLYQAKLTAGPRMTEPETVELIVSDATGAASRSIPVRAGGASATARRAADVAAAVASAASASASESSGR